VLLAAVPGSEAFLLKGYAPTVNTDLWFGAVTTLAGVVLGGAISYVLSRQQIREAGAQRLEAERWDRTRRSMERRFDVYKDFLTQARRYRNAIRLPYGPGSGLRIPVGDIDDLARATDAAGSVVSLVSESPRTQAACAKVMRAISTVEDAVHGFSQDPEGQRLDKANDDFERMLRAFQAAARQELGAVDPSELGSTIIPVMRDCPWINAGLRSSAGKAATCALTAASTDNVT
jgi:hypothetical protein